MRFLGCYRNPFAGRSYLRSPIGSLLVSFLFVYLVLIEYCRTHYYRDPTSAFFDYERGFDQIYSRFRTSQALDFIRNIDAVAQLQGNESAPMTKASSLKENHARDASSHASLCLGIASFDRGPGLNYLDAAVGSLLVDLSPQEREDIHLVLFIPHTDPAVHPFYSSNWMYALGDKVLVYDAENIGYVKKLEESDKVAAEKGLFDYTYLLKACEATGSPYVMLVEDDVIAMDGWYHRTKQALVDAERKTREKYLYLRLFYTQKFLGWNKEEWLTYFTYSLLGVSAMATLLVLTRRYLTLPQVTRLLSNKAIMVLCVFCAPLCIILFFSAGRASMLSMPSGVHQMSEFGCCTQAIAFPHDRVADITSLYTSKKQGFADSLLEEYANDHDELRWALSPSIFQHVGAKSSKYEQSGRRRGAKSIWNFMFELNDPVELQKEHETAVAVADRAKYDGR